jgi:hypothetical protein
MVVRSASRKSDCQSPLVTSPASAKPRISGSRGAAGAAVPLDVSGAARRNVDGRPRTEVDLGVEELAGLGAGGDPRLEREVALIEDLGGTGLSGQDLDRTGVGGEPGGRGGRAGSHRDR